MKKFIVLIALSPFALFASAEDVMKISVDHFTFKVPVGWYAVYTGSSPVVGLFSPVEANDDFQENANLVVEKLPRDYTIGEYQDAAIQTLQSVFANFQLIERKDNYHIYKATTGQGEMTGIQMIYIKAKEAYVLTFTAKPDTFDRYRGSFKAIADGFSY